MTVILPKDYHARQALIDRRIDCITQERAVHQDIRPLRIGILNIMPQAKTYEYSLLFPLGRSVMQIDPIWIKLKTHGYRSTPEEHLASLYVYFEDAVQEKHLDGLIVTGAPVEAIPFEKVTYWKEIREILTYARKNIVSTMGICWGGLALAKMMGIDKEPFSRKLFGVFEARNLDKCHRITGEFDDVFYLPQSRHSGIPDHVLEAKRDTGDVNLLAHSREAGYFIFESCDQRLIVHLGHPEYDAYRLIEEYERDKERDDMTGVLEPENVDIENPVNVWRCNGLEFFSQWIKDVYERTPY